MVGKVLLFVGLVLIGVGYLVSQSSGGVSINRQRANAEDARTAKYAIGGGLAGLGVLFLVGGLVSMVRASKAKKRNQYIMQNGIDTQGTVTYVDKNYAILVNKNPIYSIVEYIYKDKSGQQFTRRIPTVNSELVIRKQIKVGSIVPIKYAPENPSESLIIM